MDGRAWGRTSWYLHQNEGTGEAEKCTEQLPQPQTLTNNSKDNQMHRGKTNCNKLVKKLETLVVHCSKTRINSWEQTRQVGRRLM